jgi:tetratricopeptide (TPR) repeat protein
MDDVSPATASLPARPLPIGAFGLPFGFLLLPPGPDTEPAREALLAGRLPKRWPERLRGHRAALDGDLDGALRSFGGDDPVSRFNRFVLDPDADRPGELREALGPPLGVLVDLVLFATGRTDKAPDPSACDGELAALLLAARAVEPGQDDAAAVTLLSQAAAEAAPLSPALSAVLRGALAQARKAAGDLRGAVSDLESGIALLSGTDLRTGRAEQHLELAATYHELAATHPAVLAKALHHYHCALQETSREQAPEVFAAAHAGLAAAYLTMPMAEASDQLRMGVAVGSLRAALTVYTRESHPAEWSSAQLNLANALVYAPSAHQGDNLTEAVELYEGVLQARSRTVDPVGYARALANQGNALAHLGMFGQARAKLAEARSLFEECQEWDAVASVRGLLDELGRRKGERAAAGTVTDA